MEPLRLSVLDQSPIAEGSNGSQALRNSLDLAQTADALGYHRYWVAEHHGTPGLACTSPEALIGPIAHSTSRIRVGSGGIMLPHYSPFKVAETFSMLAGLYPDRIDLGIGRAAGTDALTTLALQRDRRQRPPDDFREHLEELLGYYGRISPTEPGEPSPLEQRFLRRSLLPGEPHRPAVFLLGSSAQSAIWAAELGLPYVFADFISSGGAGNAALYRRRFVASKQLAEPHVLVAAWVICADTDEEAARLASSFVMMMALMLRGQLIPVPPVETALRFLAEQRSPLPPRRIIAGSPDTVVQGINSIAGEYGASEVMLVNILYNHDARRRSYELVAGRHPALRSLQPAGSTLVVDVLP